MQYKFESLNTLAAIFGSIVDPCDNRNLLKLDSDVKDMSIRAKQIYYRNNPDAVCRLLFEVIPGINK